MLAGFFPTNACLQTATYGEYLYASCSDDGTQLFESFCADSACKTTMKNTTHPTEECFANGDTGMYVKYSCGNE